ncbi:MAG: hypothetical protein H0T42_07225 [Deltaproteobacteria bacterium]|nr:hypothetical protein [Deltaproteobacteria bacterium]
MVGGTLEVWSTPQMRTQTATLLLVLSACSTPEDLGTAPDAAAIDAPPGSTAMAMLPPSSGTCPTIVNGDVTFAPAGIAPRKVKLAFTAGAPRGPLVVYWHATGSSPVEAAYALGATLETMTAAGAVIATPYSDPVAGQFEWFIVNGSDRMDDFILADEIVACLATAGWIDPAHVHSVGMSAGGLQTTALSFLRSAYVASVATFSGGMPPGFDPEIQRPDNKFAALIFEGGASDNVFGVDFSAASETYKATLIGAGHFAAICDHGKGHKIPLEAAPSIAAFFTANGFGAWPSPYASGLPATFPTYCTR